MIRPVTLFGILTLASWFAMMWAGWQAIVASTARQRILWRAATSAVFLALVFFAVAMGLAQ